jgi:hypothetical protein
MVVQGKSSMRCYRRGCRRSAEDVDFETLRQTPEHFDFNITGCRYADFFRQLGEPELGALLLCESDFHVTELIGSPDVKLERTQTIMKAAKYCDFRWRMNQGSSSSE